MIFKSHSHGNVCVRIYAASMYNWRSHQISLQHGFTMSYSLQIADGCLGAWELYFCFFLTRILMILMIKQFWKTPALRVARSLLLWLQGWWLCFSSTSAPQRLKAMTTVWRTAAECLSAEQSAPQEKGSQTEWALGWDQPGLSLFFSLF